MPYGFVYHDHQEPDFTVLPNRQKNCHPTFQQVVNGCFCGANQPAPADLSRFSRSNLQTWLGVLDPLLVLIERIHEVGEASSLPTGSVWERLGFRATWCFFGGKWFEMDAAKTPSADMSPLKSYCIKVF